MEYESWHFGEEGGYPPPEGQQLDFFFGSREWNFSLLFIMF